MTTRADTLGIGMLGTAFMGRAHANAYRTLAAMLEPLPARIALEAVAGRDAGRAAEAAARFGFARSTTDWRTLVDDPAIAVLDNAGPNDLHAEATIRAARAGKHVICEKPLARDAAEARTVLEAVAATGVVHMCAFNYRFVPALRLAWELVRGGELGEVRRYRASYLQDWLADPAAPATWRLQRARAGSGALGDLGSHVIDLARYLVGEIVEVSGATQTFVAERPGGPADVDEAFQALVTFDGGATGVVEASRICPGRANSLVVEINGTRGSLAFDLERLNELWLQRAEGPPSLRGFQRILVTAPTHPWLSSWWPPGHVLGWEHTFVHELHHFLGAVAGGGAVAPHGATFEDGYRVALVCDAVLASAAAGERVRVEPAAALAAPAAAIPYDGKAGR